MKIKKITLIEITTLIIVFIAMGIYFSPRFLFKQEVMQAAKIKANSSIFTARVLEEFATNKDAKPSDVAKIVSEELNVLTKNPYYRKKPSYTFEAKCKGCNSVSYDDVNQMVIVTTYNKKSELVARTVIKPPSYVTYLKHEDNGKKKK